MKQKILLSILLLFSVGLLWIYFTKTPSYGYDKGYTLQNFILPASTSNPKELYAIQSEFIFLEFWASWCPNCKRQHKSMNPILTEKSSKISHIAISLDADSTLWIHAKKMDFNVACLHYRDSLGWDSPLTEKFNFNAIPFNLLLNREYVIIGKNVLAKDLEELTRN